tara:strand:+ start:598 stop:1662 length:1065 start_codon:yes stop_codon:yes gene_type:complete
MKNIHVVVGGRPNLVKAFNILKELKKLKVKTDLIMTNQHYDYELNKIFFDQFKLQKPKIIFNNRSSNIIKIKKIYKNFLKKNTPDLIIVFGDMNSSLAAAKAGYEKNIPIAHVESGLRSYDKRMPEEKNRIEIDKISSFLFCTTYDSLRNLNKEKIKGKKFFVGNPMIDTLKILIPKIKKNNFYKKFNLLKKKYGVLTLHRNFNVDSFKKLHLLISEINKISNIYPLVFSIHPRTRNNLIKYNLLKRLNKKIIIKNSLSYFNFMNLIYNSKFVVTDSGGIQEETSLLRLNCFTLRNNTERPITIIKGTNYLVKEKAFSNFIIKKINKTKKSYKIKFWDGKSAIRIALIIKKFFN